MESLEKCIYKLELLDMKLNLKEKEDKIWKAILDIQDVLDNN